MMNTCRNQGNPSLEELQESGPASGESLAVVEVMGARDGSAGIIAGAMGADAHAPNAPAFMVPGVLLSIPRCEMCPSCSLHYLILKCKLCKSHRLMLSEYNYYPGTDFLVLK